MLDYRTPGVYFEWLDTRGPAIVPLRTDIAGFVGISAAGPLHLPVKVESFTQFVSIFGKHTSQAYLSYAVEGFFANGGQTCWIVRIADPATASPASFELKDEKGKAALRLTAISRVFRDEDKPQPVNPGTYGEDITFALSSTARDRFTLIISLENAREIWRDLSLRPHDPRYVEALINHKSAGSNLVRADVLPSASSYPFNTPDPIKSRLRGGIGRLTNGSDGLAGLTVDHFTGGSAPNTHTLGLAALELIDEVSVVAMPDIMMRPSGDKPTVKPPPRDCNKLNRADIEDIKKDKSWVVRDCCPVTEPPPPPKKDRQTEFAPVFTFDQIQSLQAALVGHCEKLKDRIAVLDTPLIDPRTGMQLTPESAESWRNLFDTRYAALYFPWIKVPDPLQLAGILRSVPPSGYVAGVYARGDLSVGVHKPPANEELEAVKDVQVAVDDISHGTLSEAGVNVIRTYRGRGVRVAGARTLSSDQQWRYVNVRRLLIMIEEALDEQTQWTVFEPNNPDLWREMDRVARSFLEGLWHEGRLDGASSEEAYSVRCDEATNPPQETEVGRMICEIGVLPPWPAEFVVVRIGKTEGGTEIIEE